MARTLNPMATTFAKANPVKAAYYLERIRTADTDQTREAYRTGQFPRAENTKDVDERYRWDLWWHAAKLDRLDPLTGHGEGTHTPNTDGTTSDHIDTFLRRAVPPLA